MADHPYLPATLVDPVPSNAEVYAADPAAPLTLIYIHGIKNKPPVEVIKCQWDMAIFRKETAASRFAYWVNRKRYPRPVAATCADRDVTDGLDPAARNPQAEAELETEIRNLGATPEEQAFLEATAGEMLSRAPSSPKAASGAARDWLARYLARSLLPDAYDFLYDKKRHAEICRIADDAINASGGRSIVIGHSLGSVIAYEVLRKRPAGAPEVPLFLTLGSPLGLSTVMAVLRRWSGADGKKLPCPPGVMKWINVAARYDVIAVDADLADEFDGAEDYLITNGDDDPHSATGYLVSGIVRSSIHLLTGFPADAGRPQATS
ncbi:MAG TPA: hypothetical protein VF686_10020 [Brevundimonas sp.]